MSTAAALFLFDVYIYAVSVDKSLDIGVKYTMYENGAVKQGRISQCQEV